MRTPDGRLTVKGLMPGQQLIQTSDGKLQVVTTTQIQQSQPKTTAQTTPIKTTTVVKSANATGTPGKICVFLLVVLVVFLFFFFFDKVGWMLWWPFVLSFCISEVLVVCFVSF